MNKALKQSTLIAVGVVIGLVLFSLSSVIPINKPPARYFLGFPVSLARRIGAHFSTSVQWTRNLCVRDMPDKKFLFLLRF